jgi:general secretion pathway protein I
MNRRGFTLLEVLLAMIILASGIILLATSWSSSHMRMKKTQINTEVAALLERKVAEVEVKYRGKPLESIPEGPEEDEFEGATDYRWRLESRKFEFPDLSGVYTSRDGGADQNLITMMKQFSEHLTRSIKEVKVTIIYKYKKRNLEYSATLLFVDYDKDLPMNLGAQ